MRIEVRDNSTEQDVLTQMVVSGEVIAQVAPKWSKEGLFGTPWANIVGRWCVEYWSKYGKPPGKAVVAIYRGWKQGKDEDTCAAVEQYLTQLSGRYERAKTEANPAFVIDQAKKLFNRVKVQALIDQMTADLELGKEQAAIDRLNTFDTVEVGSSSMVDFFKDDEASKTAINQTRDSMISYHGALGDFFGDNLERDGFISILAPMKRGKSFWLVDMALRAAIQRRRTVLFQCGDMSKNQMLKRMNVRVACRPLKATKPDKPVKNPTAIAINDEGTNAIVEYEEKRWVSDMTDADAAKARARLMQVRIKSKDSYLFMSPHATSSITVGGIRAELDGLTRKGWHPDVVVIDYADILKPMGSYSESREGVNATWKELRKLSQELHCLVVTATQSNAAGLTADTLGAQNFSEDNRKLAHVTGMFGINQTSPQKISGVQRLNWLMLRDDEFVSTHEVWVAGCLAVGNPAVVSTF